MPNLTPKQGRFVDEYLVDLNGTQAAIRTGYSPNTAQEQASRLLSKHKVQTVLSRRQAELRQSTQITQARIVQELARIAFSDITDVMDWDAASVTLRDSSDLDPAVTAAVKKVARHRRGTLVEMHDKLSALEKLGRHLGLFEDSIQDLDDRVEIHVHMAGEPDAQNLSVEEVERMAVSGSDAARR